LALALFGLSGCAWLGIGSSDKNRWCWPHWQAMTRQLSGPPAPAKRVRAVCAGFGDPVIMPPAVAVPSTRWPKKAAGRSAGWKQRLAIAGGVGVADDMVIVGGSKG
jgi:hypothetical protein